MNLSHYFWSLGNGSYIDKLIPILFTSFGRKCPLNKTESLQLKHILILIDFWT